MVVQDALIKLYAVWKLVPTDVKSELIILLFPMMLPEAEQRTRKKLFPIIDYTRKIHLEKQEEKILTALKTERESSLLSQLYS